jgi:hypothetical protein
MANDTFASFQQVSSLTTTDFLVGYRNISETRISYNDLGTSLTRFVSGNNNNWDSTYSTVNSNSASWEESADILPTVINYLSTTNVILSAATIRGGLSALSLQTDSLSSRNITLVHIPENDGTNPNIIIGETSATTGFSGFNIFYDELQNKLTITSLFSGVSSAIVTIDRSGVASGSMFPYVTTFSKFITAAVASTFYPASLSGMIPASEITSRIAEGRGMMRGSFLFATSAGSTQTQVQLQFANNPAFTSSTSIFTTTMTPNTASSIIKVFEAYVVDGNFIVPNNTANPYSVAAGYLTNAGSATTDLYYRVGFIAGNTGTLCILSGGSIRIIP